jgi:DNA-binding FadR family transcriptional regulator
MSEDPAYRFDVQEARIILEGGTTWYAAQRATQEDLVNIRHHYDQINHFQALGMMMRRLVQMRNFIWRLLKPLIIWF